MFHSARLKLTAWYLLIIVIISLFFSVLAYNGLTFEISRSLELQALRSGQPKIGASARQAFLAQLEKDLPGFAIFSLSRPRIRSLLDEGIYEEARQRTLINLLWINLGVLGVASVAAYFLAGRTLRPIEEMYQEQNRFIADASHELRTPLTALKTVIEVNLRDKNLSLTEAKKILKSNLSDVEDLKTLSDNLIQLARQPNERNGFSNEFVSLLTVVQDAVKKVSTIALQKRITIEQGVEDCRIQGDRQSLTQLLVIVLDNAVKYSREGKLVSLTVKANEHEVFIILKDQGIGIEKKELPHIFDRFYRAETSRSKMKVPGYGLGLSIAKKIVEAHKGKISVESVVGKGTTLTISLPNSD